MQAYGSDRVRADDDGRRYISSRYAKPWKARRPRTTTSREHPGTAVLWDESWFEVVAEEPLADGAVRYVLEPWPEEHAIRVSDRYDDESERHRESEHRATLRREKGRKTANLFGMFTGQLPAVVQEQLASELGLLPTRLTLLSIIPQMLFIAFVLDRVVRGRMAGTGPPPLWMALAAVYLFIESVCRFGMAMHGRPMGSAVGLLVYSIGYAFGLRKAGGVSPVAELPGTKLYRTEAPPDVALRDAVETRAPLMTLLTPAEQNALRDRYGYDYRETAATVAGILLVFSVAGAISSVVTLSRGASVSALISLLVAGALAVEQAWRLVAFRSGPAGSFLAVFVRPFVGRLLR